MPKYTYFKYNSTRNHYSKYFRKTVFSNGDKLKEKTNNNTNSKKLTEKCDNPLKVVALNVEESSKDLTNKDLNHNEEEEPTSFRIEDSQNEKRRKTEEPKMLNASGANQLDFLLSKASNYSKFITTTLDESQQTKAKESGNILNNTKRKGEEEVHVGISANFTKPSNLSKDLKDQQIECILRSISLFETSASGVLPYMADYGRIIPVISVIDHLRRMKGPGPFLLVAPKNALHNWKRDLQKKLPSQLVFNYSCTRTVKDELKLQQIKNSPDPVILTTYEMVVENYCNIQALGEFKFLVVDGFRHSLRKLNNILILLLKQKQIQTINRLLLLGEPINNNLDDLWSLLNFVYPVMFEDFSTFRSNSGFYDITSLKKSHASQEQILLEQRASSTIDKLHNILRPFLLQSLKKDNKVEEIRSTKSSTNESSDSIMNQKNKRFDVSVDIQTTNTSLCQKSQSSLSVVDELEEASDVSRLKSLNVSTKGMKSRLRKADKHSNTLR